MRKTNRITFLGLMLAIILVLSAIEHTLPPLPFLPPNMKLGLSNVVTMYCIFFVDRPSAVALNALKSGFVFLMRGVVAGILSFSGGMLSIGVVILLLMLFRRGISYAAVSVASACAHNIGQYSVAMVLVSFPYFIYYLPVLIFSGIVMGVITGTLLKVLLPALSKMATK